MTTYYYYEREKSGTSRTYQPFIIARDDDEAIKILNLNYKDVMLIYKESDTKNGLPFIEVWKKG